jgi:membrane protein DedA with SNARE-associated domain
MNYTIFINNHIEFIYSIVFLFAFLESLAFIGTIIPQASILLFLGVIIKTNEFKFNIHWIICDNWRIIR